MQLDWELWLDNHISPIIAKWINEEFGLKAKSSYILKMTEMDDVDIFQKAKEAGNVIILTKDADFELLVRRLGAPPKIINITFGNADNRLFWARIKPKILFTIDALTTLNLDFIQID